jgi:tellurite resistance protein TerA
MLTVVKGQKADVTKNNFSAIIKNVSVCAGWNVPNGLDVDMHAFLIGVNGLTAAEDHFIHRNQTNANGGAVQYKPMTMQGHRVQFDVDFSKIQNSIEKIIFSLSITSTHANQPALSVISSAYISVIFNKEVELLRFPITQQFTDEKAIVMCELYRYNGEWKFNAVSSGFFGGLSEICTKYGAKMPINQLSSEKVPPPINTPTTQNTPVNLQKITLQKKGDSVSLLKKFTKVITKLTWKQAVDLDLHAFYILKNGKFGHIYYSEKGKIDRSPYISLDQDAGVGNTAGDNEENLMIGSLKDIKEVIFATNIFRFFDSFSSGDNFAKYDGKVIIKTDAGDHIEVPLNSSEIGKWCIIAKIDNSDETKPKIININKVQQKEPVVTDM